MTSTWTDIHILQTIPPHNINRDENGSPKTAFYGGVERSRVSSQAWKRATRRHFDQHYSEGELGVRTKRVVEPLLEEFQKIKPEIGIEEAADVCAAALGAAGLKLERPKLKKGEEIDLADFKTFVAQAKFLVFISRAQAKYLAKLAAEAVDGDDAEFKDKDRKAAAKSALSDYHSADLALFGRMVAKAPDMNVDAACQVAHALGIHSLNREFDYYTAVDDQNTEEESGAGMIGTIEFNSATVYRYATINADLLQENLGSVEATATAVGAFINSFVRSMPTGKQNTFAAQTLPEAVVVVVREKRPVNLVQAFENPVEPWGDKTRLEIAASRLSQHAQEINAAYGDDTIATYVVRLGAELVALDALGSRSNLPDTVAGVSALVADRLGASS